MIYCHTNKLGVGIYTCNPSTREAKKRSIKCLRSTRATYERETTNPFHPQRKKTSPTFHSWNTFQRRLQIGLQSEGSPLPPSSHALLLSSFLFCHSSLPSSFLHSTNKHISPILSRKHTGADPYPGSFSLGTLTPCCAKALLSPALSPSSRAPHREGLLVCPQLERKP